MAVTEETREAEAPALDADAEYFCENCGAFRAVAWESLHSALDTDAANAGYLVGDLLCRECSWVVATRRVAGA